MYTLTLTGPVYRTDASDEFTDGVLLRGEAASILIPDDETNLSPIQILPEHTTAVRDVLDTTEAHGTRTETIATDGDSLYWPQSCTKLYDIVNHAGNWFWYRLADQPTFLYLQTVGYATDEPFEDQLDTSPYADSADTAFIFTKHPDDNGGYVMSAEDAQTAIDTDQLAILVPLNKYERY